MAQAQADGLDADVAAALGAGATLLGHGTVEVDGAGLHAQLLGLIPGTGALPLEFLAGRAADPVLLAVLHQASVQRWTVGLARAVPAEEGTRRVGYLERLASRTDVGQRLGLPAAGDRWTRGTGAGHLDQLAGLLTGTGYSTAGIAALAPGTAGTWLDLQT